MNAYPLWLKKDNSFIVTFPKCACTTLIKWAMKENDEFDKYGLSEEHNQVKEHDNIHLFGRHHFGNLCEQVSPGAKGILVYRDPKERLLSYFLGNLMGKGDFSELVNGFYDDPESIKENYHTAPMLWLLQADYLIDEDVALGFERVHVKDLDIPIKILNHTGARERMSEFYDVELERKVEELYVCDYQRICP